MTCVFQLNKGGKHPALPLRLSLQTAKHSSISTAPLQHDPKRSRLCFNTALSSADSICTHLSREHNGISHWTPTAITSPALSTVVLTWKTKGSLSTEQQVRPCPLKTCYTGKAISKDTAKENSGGMHQRTGRSPEVASAASLAHRTLALLTEGAWTVPGCCLSNGPAI